ncbi:hypothetical protein ABEX25_23700 [Paenibacillus thiaminolyticus]|uniref:hypothetical protein n=1 Tax=Paenibacillus thiaminolyticus TaxID=49283 RepID=UPI003D2E45C6
MDKAGEAGESGYPQEATLHRMSEREGIGEAGVLARLLAISLSLRLESKRELELLGREWMHDGIEVRCEGQEKEAKLEGVMALLFNIPVVQGYWAIHRKFRFCRNESWRRA